MRADADDKSAGTATRACLKANEACAAAVARAAVRRRRNLVDVRNIHTNRSSTAHPMAVLGAHPCSLRVTVTVQAEGKFREFQ